MFLKCPFCNIEYNSPEAFNVHIQGCYYRDCPIPVQIDFESLSFQELKDMAQLKGIKTGNMKKTEILKVLKEMEE